MPSLRHSVDIRQPPEVVFDYLDNFANDPSWRSNVVEMVPLGKDGDLMGKWSRQMERRQVPGRVIETEAVLTARERPRHLAFRRASGPIRPAGAYRLERRGKNTHLEFELDVPLVGAQVLLAPLISLMLNVVIRPTLPGDFSRLRQRVEDMSA